MGTLRNIAILLMRDILNSDVSLIMFFRSFIETFFKDGIIASVTEKTILYIIDLFNYISGFINYLYYITPIPDKYQENNFFFFFPIDYDLYLQNDK